MTLTQILETLATAAEAGQPCPQLPDLDIELAGSVALLRPCTPLGWQWIADNLQFEPWQDVGGALALEPAAVAAIVEGAQVDGLIVNAEALEVMPWEVAP